MKADGEETNEECNLHSISLTLQCNLCSLQSLNLPLQWRKTNYPHKAHGHGTIICTSHRLKLTSRLLNIQQMLFGHASSLAADCLWWIQCVFSRYYLRRGAGTSKSLVSVEMYLEIWQRFAHNTVAPLVPRGLSHQPRTVAGAPNLY